MSESNASLETSAPNNQSNSQTANNGVAPVNKAAPANKPQEQQANKPKTLEEIFGDPSDKTSLEINLGDDTPDDPEAPLDSLERLIKRNKLTPEQAYAIKIPMPNGAEALTIGELKDKISELTDFEIRVTEFDDRRIRQEGELLKSQGEMRELLGVLPKDAIKPEVLQKLRERQEGVARRERQLTLEHIPEWRDEQKRTTEIEGMMSMLSNYGFDESFLNSVQDHRALKFIRDTFLMRSRIQKSLELVRNGGNPKTKPSGKAKPAVKPNNTPARKTQPTQNDKLAEYFKSKE